MELYTKVSKEEMTRWKIVTRDGSLLMAKLNKEKKILKNTVLLVKEKFGLE
jgi:hypothetical protein